MVSQEWAENLNDLFKNNRGKISSPSQFDKQSKIDSFRSNKRIQEDEKEHDKDVDEENTVFNIEAVPMISIVDGEETSRMTSKPASKV